MSEFTIRVHTDTNQLHIDLPEGMGPGYYTVQVFPVPNPLTTLTKEEEAYSAETFRQMQELAKRHGLQKPAGWKFNRDELYD